MGVFWKLNCCFLWLVPTTLSGTLAEITDLLDTTAVRGTDTTLYCSNSEYTSGFALWSDVTDSTAPVPFATRADGVSRPPPPLYAKYENFDLDAGVLTQLDLKINNVQLEDEGTYSCTLAPTAASATLTVEIEGTDPVIILDGDSSGTPIRLTAGEQSVLRCTASGFRPAVDLRWYKNDVQITAGITQDAPTDAGGGAFTTSGTYTFIPSIPDNEQRLECRTTGQVVAAAKTGGLTLNVQYAPVVEVVYSGGRITCYSDANPLVTFHQIILNGTDVLKSFTNSPGSADFKPEYCTDISCNATNTIGTRTAVIAEQICPGYVEPTMERNPATEPVFDPPPGAQGIHPGVIAVVVIVVIIFVAVPTALGIVLWRRHLKQQGRTKTDGQGGGNYLVPHIRGKDISSMHYNDQASPGLEPHHPKDVPLEQVTTAVVYESIPSDGRVEPEASVGVAYGNVGPNLSFSRDLVVIENELGRGAFGRVLLGKALGIQKAGKETKVAVKTLKEGADRQARMELLAELELMKKVGSHPNVVRLLGYCAEKDPVYVIVEYLAKGDLKHVLLEYRDKDPGTGYSNLPGLSKSLSRTLVKFARDVANGMAFISSQKCVHRDLAARNVLVGDDLVCKVSDFGLARDVMNIRIYQRESQGPLPMRWMALESILDDVYTTESDVWSFGILLWEIVTLGARPYPMMKTKTMMSQLQQGYRMPKPQHCKTQLYDMMRSCWQKSPKDRATFLSLYQQLEDMLSEDEDYITIHKLDESIYEVTMMEDTNEKL